MSDLSARIPVRDLRAEGRSQQLVAREQDQHRRAVVRQERQERSERHAGYAIYWMYLLSPLTAGVSTLVGLLMASARSTDAAPVNASHFRYQVRSFWTAFLTAVTGGAWAAVGGIASVAGNASGGELALAGGGLAALSGMGFFAASLFGLTRLTSRGAIGSPDRS